MSSASRIDAACTHVGMAIQPDDLLRSALGELAQHCVDTVLRGGKLLIAADAEAMPAADHLLGILLDGQGRVRPPLAALLMPVLDERERASRQREALIQPADFVLCLLGNDPGLGASALIAGCIEEHHAVKVIAPCPSPGVGDAAMWLTLPPPHDGLHLLRLLTINHALCQSIDDLLLGEDA